MEEKVILKASKIHKRFFRPLPVSLLNDISLTVNKGEAVAITGRSGEGKSTLLHILGTLENPCQGTLEIAQQEVNRLNRSLIRNQHIAFVFQSFHLLEDYTALENVLMPARIGRNDISEGSLMHQRACALLERVGLGARMHFHVKLLSGGEKQRVAVARAFLNDPDLIFADEPTGNLDSQSASIIHELLFEFVNISGKSLVLVTHDPGLARMCHSQYSLQAGHLFKY